MLDQDSMPSNVTPVKAGKIFHIVLILLFNGLPYTPLSTRSEKQVKSAPNQIGPKSNLPQIKSAPSQIGPIFVVYYCQHAKLNKQLGLRNSLVYKRESTSIAIILFEYFIMSFPCVICYNHVRPRQHAFECDSCQSWQNISYRFNLIF
jgi:hypothetical protein